MNFLYLLVPAVAAALLGFTLTPAARVLAIRLGAIDRPDERKVHLLPTPRMGGLAVVAAVAAVIAAMEFLGLAQLRPLPAEVAVGVLLGLLPVLAISVVDDIRPLGALVKFGAHFTGAAIAVAFGVRLGDTIHLFGNELYIGIFAIPISILWIAGLTNAFNLVDGLDGLSAGLALISAASLAGVALLTGRYGLAVSAAVLAGALIGFLPWNVHPAKIFLGDSGSASIGFFLAALALRGGSAASAGLAVLVPLLVLGLPLADTVVSMARRFVRRLESGRGGMFEADRGHFHHKLLDLGLTHRKAVLTLYGVGIFLAIAGFFSVMLTAKSAAVMLATIIVAAFIAIGRLNYDEFAVIRRGTILKIYDAPVFRTAAFVVFADLLTVAGSIYGAIVLKYDDWGLKSHVGLAQEMLVILSAVSLLVFVSFRLYHGAWRFASVEDFVRSAVAAGVAALAGGAASFFLATERVSATFFVLYALLLVFSITGTRGSYRALSSYVQKRRATGTPVLIYGAGVAGVTALREILSNPHLEMRPIGFLDDDPRKSGRYIQGFPIIGSTEAAIEMMREGTVRGIVVSSDKVAREKVVWLRAMCERNAAWLRYFRIDFHSLHDYEFNVYADETGPRLRVLDATKDPSQTALPLRPLTRKKRESNG